MHPARILILISLFIFSFPGGAAVSDAPAIKLPSVDGQFDLQELRGKVVYLDFWASWCRPCVKSFPWMHEIKQKYGEQGLEVVAVNVDSEREPADEFLKRMNINFIVAYDHAGDVAEAYELRGMPSSFLIGRDGKIHATHTGFREKDKDRLERALKILLDGK